MPTERNRGRVGGGVAVSVVAMVLALILAGCGAIPNSSSPQPISQFARQGPTNAVPTPQADMDPESLVRAFLKATADPRTGHRAARKFLTAESADRWDDRGDMIVVDEINVFVDERTSDSVRLRLVGDNVGTLKTDGQLLPATGRVETAMTLRRVAEQWRIDGALPKGTMVDRRQFDSTYRPASVYFTNRDRTRLIADPRWLYSSMSSDPTVLVNRIVGGRSADLADSVDSALPNGAALRGQVSTVPGGGVQMELTGIGGLSVKDRTLLAAQIVWTLEQADIGGPYVINADGGPLIPERSAGWRTADVRTFDPSAEVTTDVGLNVITGGALFTVTDTGKVPVDGPLGSGRLLRSAAIAPDGSRIAAVLAHAGRGPKQDLAIGPYGGEPRVVVSGESITRPSFGPDANSVWVVVDGRPMRWMRDTSANTETEQVTTVDASAVGAVARGPISELQISPDGVRAVLLVGGQVIFAVVTPNAEGGLALTSPRIAAYNVGNRAVSVAWASPTTVMLARDAVDSPVVQLSVNGSPAVGLLSGNLSPPVRAVAANRSTVYAGDARGVLRLGSTNGQPDQYWTEVAPAADPDAIPVVP